MDKEYQIKLNHNQLRVLEKALDLYTRVGIGQLEIVAEAIDELIAFGKLDKAPISAWDIRSKWTDPMKKDLFDFNSGASFGISSPNVSDKAKIGYDIQKVIQKQIAVSENHDSFSVWHNGDILHLGSEPTIKTVEIPKVGEGCDECK